MNQNNLITARGEEMQPDRIDRGLEWLKRSLPSLRECPETRKQAAAAVTALSDPAHPAKVMARVLALLNPYFDKDTPQAIREIEAEDWAEALRDVPYWAIEKAARWWKSSDNPHRRKRPLEGDVVARVMVEMDAVRATRFVLQHGSEDRQGGMGAADRAGPTNIREALSEEQRKARRRQIAEVQASLAAKIQAKR